MRTLATTLVIAALTLVTLPAQNNGPARLAGAFRLTAGGKATGYLFFDPSGLYAMAIQQAGRGRFAAAQPTPAEALAAVTTYSGSFGHYDVDGSMLTLHKDGSFDPNETRTEERDPFTFDGTRLIMTTTHARAGVGPTIEWERMPDLPNLTPLQRRFLGFRKLVLNEIRNEKGEVLPGPSGGVDAGGTKFFPEQTGYIVYTAAGAMMVHMMHPNRPKYHGAQPSGEEAQNIIHTYNIYFGSWVVNEADGIVVHKREGSFKPNTIDDVPRRFVFEGKRLTLMPPPSTQGDDTRQGYLGWELP